MINYLKSTKDLLISKILLLVTTNVETRFLKLPYYNVNIIKKVKLSQIRYFLPTKYIYSQKYFIWQGNWSKKKLSINEYRKYNLNYNSVFQIFKNKINFKRSDEYKMKLNDLKKKGVTARGFKDIKDLDHFFYNLLELHNKMKKNGYQSQKLIKKNLNDEIGVFIGPNGEIIKAQDKYGGTHRFALAKILKLKEVYINIRAVDQNFLKKYIYKNMSLKNNELLLIKNISSFFNKYKKSF